MLFDNVTSPFVIRVGIDDMGRDDQSFSVLGQTITTIAAELSGNRVQFMPPLDGKVGASLKATGWNGFGKDILDGQIDMTLPYMSPTEDRRNAFRYNTYIAMFSHNGFLVNRDIAEVSFKFTWWRAFSRKIWLIVFSALMMLHVGPALYARLDSPFFIIMSYLLILVFQMMFSIEVLHQFVGAKKYPFLTLSHAQNGLQKGANTLIYPKSLLTGVIYNRNHDWLSEFIDYNTGEPIKSAIAVDSVLDAVLLLKEQKNGFVYAPDIMFASKVTGQKLIFLAVENDVGTPRVALISAEDQKYGLPNSKVLHPAHTRGGRILEIMNSYYGRLTEVGIVDMLNCHYNTFLCSHTPPSKIDCKAAFKFKDLISLFLVLAGVETVCAAVFIVEGYRWLTIGLQALREIVA